MLKDFLSNKKGKTQEFIELENLISGRKVPEQEPVQEVKTENKQAEMKVNFNLPKQNKWISIFTLPRILWGSVVIIFDVLLFLAVMYAINHILLINGKEIALLGKIAGIAENLFNFIIIKGGF